MTLAPGRRPPAPYTNPYVAGFCLGLVLLAAFAILGHGIGASGAAAEVVAAGVNAAAPERAQANDYLRPWIANGRNGFTSWIVIEVVGIALGALVSARLAGRARRSLERGPRSSPPSRIAWAIAGGTLMGFASRLARGCTSGQALTGGALLSVGSWVFMLALFAAGFLVAPLFRKEWT